MQKFFLALIFMISMCLGALTPAASSATGLLPSGYDPTKLPKALPFTYGGTTYNHVLVWPHDSSNNHWVLYYNGSLTWQSGPPNYLIFGGVDCFYQSSPSAGSPDSYNAQCYALQLGTNICNKTFYSDVDILAGSSGSLGGIGDCPTVNYSTNDVLIEGEPYTVTTSLISPVSGFAGRTTSLAYGATWTFEECPTGTSKKHTGRDVAATSGEDVFAAHDGVVKRIFDNQHATWADAIIIEDLSGTFTTVYWHVDAVNGLAVTNTVTAGQKIATIANLGSNTHFHFGIRAGAYNAVHSLAGALPIANCTPWTAFPETTMDPANYTYN